MSISFPSGPKALRLEDGRGRRCIQEAEDLLRVEEAVVAAAAVGKPLHPELVGVDAGRTNPSMQDAAARKAGKQRRAQGAMMTSHYCQNACVGGVRWRAGGPRKSSRVGVGPLWRVHGEPPFFTPLSRSLDCLAAHHHRRRGSDTTTNQSKQTL